MNEKKDINKQNTYNKHNSFFLLAQLIKNLMTIRL